jgi:hypothetical protein
MLVYNIDSCTEAEKLSKIYFTAECYTEKENEQKGRKLFFEVTIRQEWGEMRFSGLDQDETWV